MNNVGEKYLPIGTVVMLKGASKRLMITGFCSMAAEDQATMFDYAGCMYPEGFLSSDQTALFNHDQIETVYYMGLVDEEEKTFKSTLNTLVAQMNGGAQQPVAPSVPVEPVAPVVTPTEPVEVPVPPVGPGLPGYVAPAMQQPVQPVAPSAPVTPTPVATESGFQFDANGNVIAAPQVPVSEEATDGETGEAPAAPNYVFDENGTIISA